MINSTKWKDAERFIGGLKFAVILIALFTISMIVGTFVESYFGTDFANRLIYKSPLFMLLQFLLFLSILMATLLRLPPKKRLWGFYVIHGGLLLIGCGAFITYVSGIDGHVTLLPKEPTRTIELSEDIVHVKFHKTDKILTLPLPYSAFPKIIDHSLSEIQVEKYLPFSEYQVTWLKSTSKISKLSAFYTIFTDSMSEEIKLSLHPDSEKIESGLRVGPLKVYLFPKPLLNCLTSQNKSKLIIWNIQSDECYHPESKGLEVTQSGGHLNILKVPHEGATYYFVPDKSPFPLNEQFQFYAQAPLRVISKDSFDARTALYLFGDQVSYIDKMSKQWVVKSFKDNPQGIPLPWMKLKIELNRHSKTEYPTLLPKYTLPKQKNGKLVYGGEKSLSILYMGKRHWASSSNPLTLNSGKNRIVVSIDRKKLTLPFALTLDRFKMDTSPGTEMPSSYESYVYLLNGKGVTQHHVFMNNPLKTQDFTFYQSSYFPYQQGGYASVFSANIDPGRIFKYLGSLLLVLGAIWHYLLNRNRKVLRPANSAKVLS
ncbi:MAG: hypothetical protein HN353_12550 [Bdellovibrionales bacterium]|jgi:hypothetical protein|nr:hypothetical protein [Bdellovibrionales bacterium]MBT3526346.1 hypothetical protein [Bdellovibrionales bacterium]MBT7668623.1 hypothetical protein [Bdellovibrionales bacterium]MBT7767543.1 hypothetical protein [Bdellovibrionales bacterium]